MNRRFPIFLKDVLGVKLRLAARSLFEGCKEDGKQKCRPKEPGCHRQHVQAEWVGVCVTVSFPTSVVQGRREVLLYFFGLPRKKAVR